MLCKAQEASEQKKQNVTVVQCMTQARRSASKKVVACVLHSLKARTQQALVHTDSTADEKAQFKPFFTWPKTFWVGQRLQLQIVER